MRWWEGGRHGGRELYEEATAANRLVVSSGWTRLVAVGMEVHGHMDMFERVSLGSHFLESLTDQFGSTHQSLKPDFLPEMYCLPHIAHLQPPIRYTTNIIISWL